MDMTGYRRNKRKDRINGDINIYGAVFLENIIFFSRPCFICSLLVIAGSIPFAGLSLADLVKVCGFFFADNRRIFHIFKGSV